MDYLVTDYLATVLKDCNKYDVYDQCRWRLQVHWLAVGGPHPNDPVRTMAAADAVQALQEADEAVQEDPISTSRHSSTSSLPIDIPVSLPVCHPASSPCWQQEEASSPKL